MNDTRTRRLGAIVAISAVALVLSASASAGLILKESFHDEGTLAFDDFCDEEGLSVEGAFTVDGRTQAVLKGRDEVAYFIENIRATTTLTNPETDKTVTEVVTVLQKDQKITDNGDGTITILVMGTGNDVVYGPDGKAIARNPGQTRFEILIDYNGTLSNPDDDVFLADLGVVKGSTGRTDDFCEAVVPALT
jgi:hypothetical protein